MPQSLFPEMPLAQWRATRGTLHAYSQVLGSVRRALAPPQKHWWHISLHATASGLTTTPIPAEDFTFELLLDLTTHELCIATSRGDWWDMSLQNQNPRDFCEETHEALQSLDVEVDLDCSEHTGPGDGTYDAISVENYWQSLSQIDQLLKQFKGELREETSPVQLWPHHFDLSLVWFSGRLVPGVDPQDAERADEQMAFGYSAGDEGTPNPYFYITAYPWPERLLETALPAPATWHTEGWKGALLYYEDLRDQEEPRRYLLDLWRTTQAAGARLMS